MIRYALFSVFLVWFLIGYACQDSDTVVAIQSGDLRMEFDSRLYCRIEMSGAGGTRPLTELSPSELIETPGGRIDSFAYRDVNRTPLEDDFGSGRRYTIRGRNGSLVKTLQISVYDDFPDLAVYEVMYTTDGEHPITVNQWTSHQYNVLVSNQPSEGGSPPFWTFQDASYRSRPDWVLPIQPGFSQRNYMGMNASDYGGGTPVIDLWTPESGIAVGHLELSPKLVSLPVDMQHPDHATIGLTFEVNRTLEPGEQLSTFRTFVQVHTGDYFRALQTYRELMIRQGVPFEQTPETAYEPIWCAWGYGRDFTIDQFLESLPKVKEMGYDWAVLDDGWQVAEGDWSPNPERFPQGEQSMKDLVRTIHAEGLKAKLWWAPMAVDPGTDLIREHPEYLLLNQDGETQRISWWNAYYLCPAVPAVREYTRELVETILRDWDWDGLKIDGQHLNAAPPCYNPDHNHARPEESVEAVPEFFKAIYETAKQIKPDAVVEICPCGTGYSFFTMPYMNQPVASDPTSSWQIRLKGKTFKALMGPSVAYYGDHVELSDSREDFASTVGVGGVIGTKFTWKPNSRRDSTHYLTPEREEKWRKWQQIYREKMLPKGEYLGALYDIGYDVPETHVIRNGDRFYFAFYAESWDGEIEFRGLDNRTYQVYDYVNEQGYGPITGPADHLTAQFENYLLVEVVPQ